MEWMDDSQQDLFDGEEIDRMEAILLDDMDVGELRAYKDRISRTIKAIRAQEQLWKQRVNILLDMKEEAESQIEEKS